MKNKKFTYYVLFPSVIIVWGLIVYKIVVKDGDYTVTNEPPGIQKKEQPKAEDEGYELLNNYPDPFLQEYPQADEYFDSGEPEVAAPKTVKKWPTIRFDGYIVNGTKIKCHMTINGEDKILQVNEKVMEDYIVLAITPDSVEINSQGNSRWFKKL